MTQRWSSPRAERGGGDLRSLVRVHVCVRTCARAPRGPSSHLSLTGVEGSGGAGAAEALPAGPACRRHGDALIPSSARAGPRSGSRLAALCSLTPSPPPRPPLPARAPRGAPGRGGARALGARCLRRQPRRRRSRRALPLPPLLPGPRPPRPQAALASSGRGRRPSREDAAALADAALLRLPVGAGHRLLHVLGGRLRTGRGRQRRRRQEGEWGTRPRPGPRNPWRPRAPGPAADPPVVRMCGGAPREPSVPSALLCADLRPGHSPPHRASQPSPQGRAPRPLCARLARERATRLSSRSWGRCRLPLAPQPLSAPRNLS